MADNTDQLLDNILIARSNGSENLEVVGAYIKKVLSECGAEVGTHAFTATPHGFQLVWSAAVLLMTIYVFSIYKKKYGLALLMCLITPVLLLAEFEFLLSPVSGLWPKEQFNIIGTYPGSPQGDTLIFAAHYDTTTHFGDHFSWGFWGKMQGPAMGLAFLLIIVGFLYRKKGNVFSRRIAVPAALLAALPFAAMFWFQTIGPLVRTPSIGAVDNGGSVVALLHLAEKLENRPEDATTTVKLVFFSAEEERTLGSWAYAEDLVKNEKNINKVRVINLEAIGASDILAYSPEDGFATRRYRSSDAIINFVNNAANAHIGMPLEAISLPFGTLTDGRSFLARDIEAITLRSFTGNAFPRRLHSKHDSRDRLMNRGIKEGTEFLWALVQQNESRWSNRSQ